MWSQGFVTICNQELPFDPPSMKEVSKLCKFPIQMYEILLPNLANKNHLSMELLMERFYDQPSYSLLRHITWDAQHVVIDKN